MKVYIESAIIAERYMENQYSVEVLELLPKAYYLCHSVLNDGREFRFTVYFTWRLC